MTGDFIADQWLERSASRYLHDHPNEARNLREGRTTHNEWLWHAERIFWNTLRSEAPVRDIDVSQSQLF